MSKSHKAVDVVVDAVEAILMGLPGCDPESRVRHYCCRECFLRAGEVWTSKIHKTEHPFVVLSGECHVWSERDGWQHIKAPHQGITQPGTRRILVIVEDTTWVTFHPLVDGEIDLKKIEARIIDYRPLALSIPMEVRERILGLRTATQEEPCHLVQ